MTRIITILSCSCTEVIPEVQAVLSKGGLVVFPSDTVYGLLADATNESAVNTLIKFKNRPPGKPISVFLSDLSTCKKHVQMNQRQSQILLKLLPGPFTMVLPSKHIVHPLLESETGTLGVRVPDYQPILQLASAFGKPISATSANLGGNSPHYSIDSLLHHISQEKKELIDLIVDAGKLPRNKPSTVLDLTESSVKTLRPGDVSFEKSTTYTSKSAQETQAIGRTLIQKMSDTLKQKPVVIVLTGDLGAGKTEMTRGIAEYFGIDKIISPTFVIYYEYSMPDSKQKFVHVDLYTIQDAAEFDHLGLSEYLTPGNVMVVEWGGKLGALYDEFEKVAHMTYITIDHVNESERQITIRSCRDPSNADTSHTIL